MENVTAQTAEPSAGSSDQETDGLIVIQGVHWGFIKPTAPLTEQDFMPED